MSISVRLTGGLMDFASLIKQKIRRGPNNGQQNNAAIPEESDPSSDPELVVSPAAIRPSSLSTSTSILEFAIYRQLRDFTLAPRLLLLESNRESLKMPQNHVFLIRQTDPSWSTASLDDVNIRDRRVVKERYFPAKEIKAIQKATQTPNTAETSEASSGSSSATASATCTVASNSISYFGLLIHFDDDYQSRPLFIAFQSNEERESFLQFIRIMNPEIKYNDPGSQFGGVSGSGPAAASSGVAWVPDQAAVNCFSCQKAFNQMRRRHHCRACGQVFCQSCSNHVAALPNLGYSKPVRVCLNCFHSTTAQRIQSLNSKPRGSMMVQDPAVTASPSFLSGQTVSDANSTVHTVTALRASGGGESSPASEEKRTVQAIKSTLIPPSALPSVRSSIMGIQHLQTPGGLAAPGSGLAGSSATIARSPSHGPLAAPASEPPALSTPRDRFGFSTVSDSSAPPAPVPASLPLQYAKQRARWNEFLVLHPIIDRQTPGMKKLVRKGIPAELRGQMWQILSGSRERQLAAPPSYYDDLLARIDSPSPSEEESIQRAAAEIDKDLHRTFPDNSMFESAAGLAMLRRVLLAYSVHNPVISYCQSMNFICGLTLLFMEETEAFWLLATIIEKYAVITEENPVLASETADASSSLFYHQRDLAGAHVDEKVFADLLHEKLPRVANQFERLQVPFTPIIINWLLCLFVNSLPLETALFVWDTLFTEGPKMLFRAALTVLKLNEKSILKCTDFEELMVLMKNFSAAAQDPFQFTATCFDPLWIGSFKWTKIASLRCQYKVSVIKMLAERRERANERLRKKIEREKLLAQQEEEKKNSTNSGEDAAAADKKEEKASAPIAIAPESINAAAAVERMAKSLAGSIKTAASPPAVSGSIPIAAKRSTQQPKNAASPVGSLGHSVSATVSSWQLRAALHLTDSQRLDVTGTQTETIDEESETFAPPPSIAAAAAPAPIHSSAATRSTPSPPLPIGSLDPKFSARFQFFSALTSLHQRQPQLAWTLENEELDFEFESESDSNQATEKQSKVESTADSDFLLVQPRSNGKSLSLAEQLKAMTRSKTLSVGNAGEPSKDSRP